MKLQRNSRLVRFAYSIDGFPPEHTTLCAFFWKTFLFTPLIWLLIVGGTVLMAGVVIYHLVQFSIASSGIFPAIIVLVGLVTWWFMKKDVKDRIKASTFVQGAKAIKSKFCPIITFE